MVVLLFETLLELGVLSLATKVLTTELSCGGQSSSPPSSICNDPRRDGRVRVNVYHIVLHWATSVKILISIRHS